MSLQLPTAVAKSRDDSPRFDELGSPVWRLVHPTTTGSNQLGVSVAVVGPGQRVLRHRHDYEEAYTVLNGTGLMYLEGEPIFRIESGMSIYIAAGRLHGQYNDSDCDLEIICSLAPPPIIGELPDIVETQDAPACYQRDLL